MEVSPAERTVGQLIADAIKLYGHRFWRVLGLGIPASAFTIGASFLDGGTRVGYGVVLGPFALALSYVWAVAVATDARNARGRALLVGVRSLSCRSPRRARSSSRASTSSRSRGSRSSGSQYRACSSKSAACGTRSSTGSGSRAPTSCTRSAPWPRSRSSSSSRSSRSRSCSQASGLRASRSPPRSRSSSCRRSSSSGALFSISTRRPG